MIIKLFKTKIVMELKTDIYETTRNYGVTF